MFYWAPADHQPVDGFAGCVGIFLEKSGIFLHSWRRRALEHRFL
jgi:hypothetical protein